MSAPRSRFRKIGLIDWYDHDYFGFGQVMQTTLEALGYDVIPFPFDEPIPAGIDLLFSFGPFGPQVGRYLPVPIQLSQMAQDQRPIYTHWNTELLPHPATPRLVLRSVSRLRSWFDRLAESPQSSASRWVRHPSVFWISRRMHRFRRVGDYLYAHQIAGIDVYAESSLVYARLLGSLGLPAHYVPWGTSPVWVADLQLERDIDVLWMGRRGGPRRDQILDHLERELTARGVNLYLADNVNRPAIIGQERTQFLNRAKITLNLEPTSYDNAFPYRFHTVAGNRSLIVSEPVYPHCPEYRPGTHYVAAPVERLADAISEYLQDEPRRQAIVENAYCLATEELTMAKSVAAILQAAQQVEK